MLIFVNQMNTEINETNEKLKAKYSTEKNLDKNNCHIS